MKAKITTGHGSGGSSRIPLREALPLETPFAIEFFNIHACNFKCRFCVYSLSFEKQGFDFEQEIMDLPLFCKCIDDCKEFPQKIKMIRFVGIGEPLLHPDIDRMVKYAVESDVAEKIEIISNGSLLTHDMSDRLIEAGLPQLRISVEGLDAETYLEVTGKQIDMDAFIDNIRYFYEHKNNTILNIKGADFNIKTDHQIERFYSMFGDICDTIAIEHICEIASKVDYSKLSDKMEEGKTMRGDCVETIEICPHPYYIMQICPDGTVYPCCSSEAAPSMGNAVNENLKKIWKGDIFNLQRLKMLDGAKTCGGICASCRQYLYNTFPEDIIDKEDAACLKRFYT